MKLTIELTEQEYADLVAFAKIEHQAPALTGSSFFHYQQTTKQMAIESGMPAIMKAIRQHHYSEMTKEFSHD
jgi:precorrin-4 methylase